MKALRDFDNPKINTSIESILFEVIDNYKVRGSIARNVRLALTGKSDVPNLHVGFLRSALNLIETKRHSIIGILAAKTCLSEESDSNASAIAILTECEQKIRNALETQIKKNKGVTKQEAHQPKKTKPGKETSRTSQVKEKNIHKETHRLGKNLTITIYQEGSIYNVVIMEHGENKKDAFSCEKYEINKDRHGIKHLSIYYSAQNEDADWGYTLIGDDE